MTSPHLLWLLAGAGAILVLASIIGEILRQRLSPTGDNPVIENLNARIKRCGAEKQVQKLFVKLKFSDFQQTTVECVGTAPHMEQYEKLMETGYLRRQQPVRLLGVGVRLGEVENLEQLSLFEDATV